MARSRSAATVSGVAASDLPAVRVCARCHVGKPLAEFLIKNASTGARVSYCTPCRHEYSREHYQKNVAAYVAKAKRQAAIDRPLNRAYVLAFLATHPCVDCGERDPVVLEFDHRDPAAKRSEVGRLIHSSTINRVREEIERCDVRCGNCHRIRTARQFGSYRLQESVLAYAI
jgi:hypothetical protein